MPLSTSDIENDEILQRASSVKYDSSKVWHFAEFSPGLFCLYGPSYRAPELITDDWNEVLDFYRNRPAYVPPKQYVDPKVIKGIDVSALDISL